MDHAAIRAVLADIIRLGTEELPGLLARLHAAGLTSGLEILAIEDALGRARVALWQAESTLLAVLPKGE